MAVKTTLGQQPTSVTVDAVVIRCGCGDPDSHNGVRGNSYTCPKPRSVEDKGTIAHHHKSWWKRLEYKLKRMLNPNARI